MFIVVFVSFLLDTWPISTCVYEGGDNEGNVNKV